MNTRWNIARPIQTPVRWPRGGQRREVPGAVPLSRSAGHQYPPGPRRQRLRRPLYTQLIASPRILAHIGSYGVNRDRILCQNCVTCPPKPRSNTVVYGVTSTWLRDISRSLGAEIVSDLVMSF